MSEFEKQLGEIRKEIDALDDSLLDLIVKRSSLVEKVAELKSNNPTGKLFIRPGREATMLKRMTSLYSGKFPKEAVAQIWRILISGSCNVEEQLKICCLVSGQNRDYYWLAREYFTAFSAFSNQPTSARVIGEIMDGKATLGVVPLPEDAAENDVWWLNLVGEQTKNIKVFTKLPAVVVNVAAKEPSGFVIGNVEPEETGEDKTLITVTAASTLSTASLSAAFEKTGLKVRLVTAAAARVQGGDSYLLFEAEGFVKGDDARLDQFKTSLGKPLLSAIPIGSYSTQISV